MSATRARAGRGLAGSGARAPLLALGVAVAIAAGLSPHAHGEADRSESRPASAEEGGAGAPALPAEPGPALRAGLEALEGGDAEAAVAVFAHVARTHPVVADHALLLGLRAQAAADEPEAVREGAAALLQRFPDSPVRYDAWRVRAEAAAALDDAASARAAWQEARGLAPDDEARAELTAALARSWEADEGDVAGALRAAAEAWAELFGPLAAQPAAAGAPEALVRLEAALGRPLRTAEVRVARAEALYEARHNERALEAIDEALGLALPPAVRPELERLRAFTLFRLRRYPEAVRAFAALGADEEARLYHARSLARSGRIDASVQAFEALGAEPERALGARALFLGATLLEDEGDAERARARAHYATVAGRAPARAQRAAARWRLGWMAWRDGDARAAEEAFAQVADLETDALERLRPRYWRARALARLGREEAARETYAALAASYPLTYYGLRAAERAAAPTPGLAAGAGRGAGPATPSPGEAPPDRAGPVTLPDRDLARASILLTAGLREAVRRELPGLVRRVRTDADRLALGGLLAEAGDPHTAQRVALNGQHERLARGPEPGLEALWRLAWPRAFAPAVEGPAGDHGVESALVYAVMREESGYRPEVISPVGARGLVQIMPDTGARLARRLGWEAFDPQVLLRPEPNLELGAYYLSELLARFRGRRSAAVAAYNAGPQAVQRWLEARDGLPDDVWVEAIPYDQTRQYVRRVLRSWHAYRVLD